MNFDEKLKKCNDFDKNLAFLIKEGDGILEITKNSEENGLDVNALSDKIVGFVTICMILVANAPELKSKWDNTKELMALTESKVTELEESYGR